MNLHLAIEGVLDDAKAAIRALIAAEAEPVSSTNHDAPPQAAPVEPAPSAVSEAAPVSDAAPLSEPAPEQAPPA